MAEGAGKYDDEATVARVTTSARAVVLIVFDGEKGSGFSAQLAASSPAEAAEMRKAIAYSLRDVSNAMLKELDIS